MAPGYQLLEETVPIIGIWDDNDYGLNNGGRRFTEKDLKRELWLDFIGEPNDSERRLQKGTPIYQDYFLTKADLLVQVILLDNRYDSDADSLLFGSGDVLGEDQWLWLDLALKRGMERKASMILIGAGI